MARRIGSGCEGRRVLTETYPSAGALIVVVQNDLGHFEQNGVRKGVLFLYHSQVNFPLWVRLLLVYFRHHPYIQLINVLKLPVMPYSAATGRFSGSHAFRLVSFTVECC